MNILLSIIVCTYNRQDLLSLCLQSLIEQALDKSLYEVIIVNNCSTDGTQEISESFSTQHSNFRVVVENRLGLSYARNRGWNEAGGQYVAYIDDDAQACSDWISNIVLFIHRNPEIGVFGGPYDAFYLVSPPDWFPPEYGSLNLGEQEREIILGREWIVGSNMVIRKELFYKYGGFDVNLGMIGGKTSYGEETNFFLSISDKGYKIFYVPSIRVVHLVANYKMSLKWLLISSFSAGRHYELIFNVKRSLLSHVVALLSALCRRDVYGFLRPVKMPFKRRVFYIMYPLNYQLGALVEHMTQFWEKSEKNL